MSKYRTCGHSLANLFDIYPIGQVIYRYVGLESTLWIWLPLKFNDTSLLSDVIRSGIRSI